MVQEEKPKVTFEKLQRYAREHGGYDLSNRGDDIILSFVPDFPEAVEKGDSTPPRATLFGKLMGDKVEFDHVEIEDEHGGRIRDAKETNLVYGGWLDFIEQNY
ncbi:MAG: hypothetical protein ACREBS_08005 [Nitrososphaerales archaeon]